MGGDGDLLYDYSDHDMYSDNDTLQYYNYVWVEIAGNDTFSMYDFYTVRPVSYTHLTLPTRSLV